MLTLVVLMAGQHDERQSGDESVSEESIDQTPDLLVDPPRTDFRPL